MTTRRDVLQIGACVATSAAVPAALAANASPKTILILGGTGFIGPHLTQESLRLGWKVTHFNRGKRAAGSVAGVETLIGFHKALLSHPCFVAGTTCHGVVESVELAEQAARLSYLATFAPATDGARHNARLKRVEVDGRLFNVRILEPEPPWAELARRRAESHRAAAAASDENVVSPMQGTVLTVEVSEGDAVEVGQVVAVVEAMKMENEITAHRAGTVTAVAVAPGEPISAGQSICVISD